MKRKEIFVRLVACGVLIKRPALYTALRVPQTLKAAAAACMQSVIFRILPNHHRRRHHQCQHQQLKQQQLCEDCMRKWGGRPVR